MDPLTLKLETVEMHSGGQIVRIVKSGFPNVEGKTLVDKFVNMRRNLTWLKKIFNDKPRGHANVIGVVFVEPDMPEADIGIVFVNAAGYFTMCGDATLSVSRYVVDSGMLGREPTSPFTNIAFQCPCGLVRVAVEYSNGKTGAASFESVPAYMYKQDVTTIMDGIGEVAVDICYGGNFYAVLPATRVQLDLNKHSMLHMENVATKLLETLRQTCTITEYAAEDLNQLCGIVLTDGDGGKDSQPLSHSVFFGDGMIARAPCGSGSCAQMAQLHARGNVTVNDARQFQSPSGAIYGAKILREVDLGRRTGLVIEISGRGYYIGSSTFTLEENDNVGKGFLIN